MASKELAANPEALEVSRLADRIVDGFYAYAAALEIMNHPKVGSLLPKRADDNAMLVGVLKRKNGTQHEYNFTHYLDQARGDSETVVEISRAWAIGSLLRLGDALSIHDYFGHVPEFEMIYHLRNGVAHGNRFNITRKGRERLKDRPAHNRESATKSDVRTFYEISPALNGQNVLFDYMSVADLLDVFWSVAYRLGRIGEAILHAIPS